MLKGKSIVRTLSQETRTSILVTEELANGIKESMEKGSYGKKGRSKWLNESMHRYKAVWEKEDPEDRYDAINQAASGGTEHVTLTIDKENMGFLGEVKMFMETRGEKIKDPLSRLVAVSVTLRLIQEKIL